MGLISIHLEGKVIQWHQSLIRYRQYTHSPTWNEHAMALVERFRVDYDDSMEEIKKIKQTGSVKEYQAIFDSKLSRVNLSWENGISYFLGGVIDELNLAMKLTNPTRLYQLFKTTRMQEAYLTAQAKDMRQDSFVNTQNFLSKRSSDSRFLNKPLLSAPNYGILVA